MAPPKSYSLGAAADMAQVALARTVGSKYTADLDVAVTKATNHDIVVPKQKHVVTLYNAAGRADSPKDIIRYVLGRLSDRVTGSTEWLVVLKSLMVVHRLMREAEGDLFRKVLADGLFGDRKAGRGGDDRFRSLGPPGPGLALFSLSGWKDDSTPEAWEQSAWVKAYAAYLEERCSVFSDTGCDPQAEPTNVPSAARTWNAAQLLVGLPKLQVLLRRLVDTLPKVPRLHAVTAAAAVDCVREVRLLFRAVSEALLNLVDKFFDMPPAEATAALDMYRRAVRQVHDLNAALNSLRSHEQLAAEMTRVPMPFDPPPPEFQKVMEEYINTGGFANSSAAQQQMSQAQQQFARSSQQQPQLPRQSSNGDSSPPVYQLDAVTHVNTTGVPMPPPRRSAAVVDDLFGGQGNSADPFASMQPVQAQTGGTDLFGALAPVAPAATQAPPRPALNLDALYSSAPPAQMQMGGAPYGGPPNPFGMPGMQQQPPPGMMMGGMQPQPGMMMQQPGMMMGGMPQQQQQQPYSAYGSAPQPGMMMGYGAPQNGANPMMMGQQQQQPGMMARPGMPAAPPSMYPGQQQQQQQVPAYGARPPQYGAPLGSPADPFSSYGAPAGGGFGAAPNGFGGAMPQPPAPAADPFSGLSGLSAQPVRPGAASNPFA